MLRSERRSGQDFANERGVIDDDLNGAAAGRVQLLVGIDSQQVVERASVADGRVVILDHLLRGLVGLAEDRAVLEAAAGDQDELAGAMVIAPRRSGVRGIL